MPDCSGLQKYFNQRLTYCIWYTRGDVNCCSTNFQYGTDEQGWYGNVKLFHDTKRPYICGRNMSWKMNQKKNPCQEHPVTVTKVMYHQKVVLLPKENINAYKHVSVGNLPPLRFVGGTEKKGRIVSIKGACNPEISVSVVMDVGVPVEEYLSDIVMNTRKAVICLECDCEVSWERSLGEG